MSLGIAFKGAEGIVLAADSRVTLMAMVVTQPPTQGTGQPPQPQHMLPATFDNATKLLRVAGQKHVGAVTYGVGAIGQKQPRTAHSFMPEFEAELVKKGGEEPMPVETFARELSSFFLRQWQSQGMPMKPPAGNDMVFLVGGYDKDEPYGRVFELFIPTRPDPHEVHVNDFGMIWGGQKEYTDRLVTGFDPNLPGLVQEILKLSDEQTGAVFSQLKGKLQAPIPFQFLPLQDCVNLSILLIRTTISIQKFLVGIRGVGGAIDIATITRTEGLKPIQLKRVTGEFDYVDWEERL